MEFSDEEIKKIYSQPNWYGTPRSVWALAKAAPSYLIQRALTGLKGPRFHLVPKFRTRPGASMLVLCCGPFSNLTWVPGLLGKDARILAVDFSSTLLGEAPRTIQKLGMTNVELKEADASKDLGTEELFDLSICIYGISVIPNWEGAYENLIKHTKVGGQIGVVDVSLRDGWRSMFDPLIAWSTKQYGGTQQGIGNVNRFAAAVQQDKRLGEVHVSFYGHTCGIVATRQA